MKQMFLTLSIAAVMFASTTASALAHVSVSTDTTGAGAYAFLRFDVPHGCDEAGTQTVAIRIPQDEHGFTSVTPFINASWDLEVRTEEFDEPVDVHGSPVTEGISEIVYTKRGAALPPDQGDSLHLSVRLPQDAAVETIHFPVVQSCEGGGEAAWIQVPAEGEDARSLEMPAPSITLTEGDDGHGAYGDDDTGDDKAGASGPGDGDTTTDSGVALGIGILALVLAAFSLFRSMRGPRS
jgi:periplasmic copper chaperone A